MTTLQRLIDQWQSAIEGRRVWAMPGIRRCEKTLEAPLSAESIIQFHQLSRRAINMSYREGLTDLSRRLEKARTL